MKDMKGWIFSRLKGNRELRDKYEPIQFVSCPFNGSKCQKERAIINKRLANSFQFFSDRQYDDSIDELRYAFQETTDISGSPCTQCAQLFRTRITQSMEQIHGELQHMTTGFFRWDQYKPSYEFADNVISDFKQRI
ncbi:hypothetical protein ACRTDU_01965 [Sunxiuqinia elliptica]|uniref:Uncharacterized protein n=1 Tax=Sunxiuqinia elliptica TaxID=655355 RepID=A0A1I2LPA3_9BACT|nr:hypothetical protein [Sunxiuqinia elliptica]SFF80398.1 hypothetical protein SAMN05216283_11657 [Sunxiuqinia elliptica]